MSILDWSITIIVLLLAFSTASHALLYKRDPRAAWAWIVTCVLFPPFGPLLYFLLGINRVRTKAKRLKWYWPLFGTELSNNHELSKKIDFNRSICHEADISLKYLQIANTSAALTRRPLLTGNSVTILHNGEQAYPTMLDVINNAEQNIFLVTYIFETNQTGTEFINALVKAYKRGVDVRIIVDGVGELYSYPRAGSRLKKHSIPFARFLPLQLFPPSPFLNLRNHRKILVADGKIGFTGGMNIGDRHLVYNTNKSSRIQDIHFRFTGPIVNQIEEVFLEDWGFCTGDYEQYSSSPSIETGKAICRTVTVGPDQDLNKLVMILVGAISLAQEKIFIMNPYFLPPRELIGALQSAALRGVEVNVVLPAQNNLPFVHWATRNMLWELLQYGVRVYYQPPPFAHSKLFVMDNFYAQVGSANLDPRSLRLNFEMMVEIFDQALVKSLSQHVQNVIRFSKETSLQKVDARSILVRTRDSLCWLFSPYF